MKTLQLFILISIITFSSCTTDPCIDVMCYNDGVCDDGTCLCADWYEGADCSSEERAKYYGSYIGTSSFFDEDGNFINNSTDTIPLSGNGSIVNELNADGLIFALVASGMGDFDIPQTSISDPDVTFIISGDGSFSGNLLTLNARFEYADETIEFTFTGSK